MKTQIIIRSIVFFILLSSQGILAIAQGNYSTIYLYRPKKISIGPSMVKIYFKDRLIGAFEAGSKMKYKMYSEGDLAVNLHKVAMGNTVSTNNKLSLEVKNGNEYYIRLNFNQMVLINAVEGKPEFNDDAEYRTGLVEKEEDINIPILTLNAKPAKEENQATDMLTESQYRGSGDPMKGLHMTAPKEMVIGTYYALVIGIDNYKGAWPSLKNAVSDAKAVESTIKAGYKFEVVKSLYNEQATRSNIIKEFEWLVSVAKPSDNVMIYYSGHGEFKKELNKGFWVPVDAASRSTSEYISNSDLQTYIGGMRSNHTLVIADACFSGDLFRGTTVAIPFDDSDKYYKLVHSKSSRQAITSGGIEPVMDGGRDGHSVFAYYLLKTLTNNSSRYMDASQVYSDIKIGVINNSNQTPIFQPMKDVGDEGGQFIFIKK